MDDSLRLPPKIIMDERERGEIREKMQLLPIDLEIQTLDFGDFILSSRVGVERKRGDDLTASIFDNRFFLQITKMKVVYPCPIIIIEDPNRMFTRPFAKASSIYGALNYAATRIGISIIPSMNAAQTADILFRLASQEQNQGYFPDFIPSAVYESKNLVTRNDQDYFLQGLVDCGESRANSFLDIYSSPQFVMHALKNTQITYTKGGSPKFIEGMLANISGIGPKFVDRNQKLLNSSYKVAKKVKSKTRTS